jgi:hypothetical protein
MYIMQVSGKGKEKTRVRVIIKGVRKERIGRLERLPENLIKILLY